MGCSLCGLGYFCGRRADLCGADGCADFAGDVAVGVASPAVLAGNVAVGVDSLSIAGVASLANLAGDIAVEVISLAVAGARPCRPYWGCHRRSDSLGHCWGGSV